MKRDWEIIRKLLLALEQLGDTTSCVERLPDMDDEAVSYHVRLLIASRLVTGECQESIDRPLRCVAYSLTWDGHEFLDKVRQQGVWNKVKATAREKGLSLSFDLIKTVATEVIKGLVAG